MVQLSSVGSRRCERTFNAVALTVMAQIACRRRRRGRSGSARVESGRRDAEELVDDAAYCLMIMRAAVRATDGRRMRRQDADIDWRRQPAFRIVGCQRGWPID